MCTPFFLPPHVALKAIWFIECIVSCRGLRKVSSMIMICIYVSWTCMCERESCLVLTCLDLSWLVLSCLDLTCLVLSCLVLSLAIITISMLCCTTPSPPARLHDSTTLSYYSSTQLFSALFYLCLFQFVLPLFCKPLWSFTFFLLSTSSPYLSLPLLSFRSSMALRL